MHRYKKKHLNHGRYSSPQNSAVKHRTTSGISVLKLKNQKNLKYLSRKGTKAKPHMENTELHVSAGGKLNWNSRYLHEKESKEMKQVKQHPTLTFCGGEAASCHGGKGKIRSYKGKAKGH